MSTKIWRAVRVPIKNLNAYIAKCRKLSLDAFFERSDKLIQLVDWTAAEQRARGDFVKWQLPLDDSDKLKNATLYRAVEQLVAKYKEDAQKFERTGFSVECGLNIWLDNRFAYIIPIEGAILAKARYATDYHYQDSTDKSAKISDCAWKARRDKWEKLCLNDHNATRLYHSIVDFGSTTFIPSSIALEYHFGLHREFDK